MTEIINLKDAFMNRWLFRLSDGYCLIDTGYRWHYKKFKKKLKKHKIALTDIKYVIITHMHADHVGFLKALLADTGALLIYDASDKRRLEAGKNNLNTYISRFEFLIASKMSAAFVQTMQYFPAVKYDNYADAKTQPLSDKGVEFMFLKGHTECDLCVRFEDKIFVGDLCMTGVGSSRYAPMWIYNKYYLLDSWQALQKAGARYLYPGHGKPISPAVLTGAREFWRARGVFPLFSRKK